MRLLLLCLALLSAAGCSEKAESVPELIPLPQEVVWSKGFFREAAVSLSGDTSVTGIVKQWLDEAGVECSDAASGKVEVRLVDRIEKAVVNQDEAYSLTVSGNVVRIEAVTEKGVYWAVQTLRQLADKTKGGVRIPRCGIVDWPAFRIRGFMHDVGRSYISLEEIKHEIEILTRYKINTFHWHLTENQAWRLESKIYPLLNAPENMVRYPGCYYTQEQVREFLDFCRRHHVLVIPEIDMPGHSAAFTRTFDCDMQSPKGKRILKELLAEACDLFADEPYFHIGTDEVHFTDPDFVPEMVALVRSKGKKAISWSPGCEYAPGEIDVAQLWSYMGKAKPGIPSIDSKFRYANHFDLFGDIVAVYNSRICNSEQGDESALGTVMAVWNDHKLPDEHNILLQNAFYPYMLAIAERSWLGGGSEYFDVGGVILPDESSPVFKKFADFERRMLRHKDIFLKEEPFPYVRQTNVHWAVTDAFPNEGDFSRSFPPENGIADKYSFEGKDYFAHRVTGAGINLRHFWNLWYPFPSLFKNPVENSTAYAYTWVYSPKSQDVGMLVEFQNYSRSVNDVPPPPGHWDYRGSRIWLNDRELLPPEWTNSPDVRSTEVDQGNENCTARPPLSVHLNRGWNKVFMKLPVGRFTTPEIWLVKWAFTAVFVTPDGRHAVEGLVYSPDKSSDS